jgi:tetratricopeptide (TPR) repeat protein
MDITLAQKAISLALSGNWEEAEKINLEILSDTSDDIDALNRLARCYSELGKAEKAKETAKKVLVVDPLNSIAQKCLEKWASVKNGDRHRAGISVSESFLEEPGKTKIAPLMHLGDAAVLASVDSGDEAVLLPHAHRVSVTTMDGKYIGRLHDDLAARLRNLIKSGRKFQVLIKSIDPKKDVTVFIRETGESSKDDPGPSFPTEKIEYVAFTSPELVHKDKAVMEFQEEVIEKNS